MDNLITFHMNGKSYRVLYSVSADYSLDNIRVSSSDGSSFIVRKDECGEFKEELERLVTIQYIEAALVPRIEKFKPPSH